MQWRLSALLSGAIIVGGGIALGMKSAGWSGAVAYADPVLVLLACVVMVRMPTTMVARPASSCCMPPPEHPGTVGEDAVRRTLIRQLDQLALEVWAVVEVTGDAALAQ